MKYLLKLSMLLFIFQKVNAAELTAFSIESYCFAYGVSEVQLNVPSNVVCFNSKELFIYNKFSLPNKFGAIASPKVERISKLIRNLPSGGIEPKGDLNSDHSNSDLFILTDKGTMVFIENYKVKSSGIFFMGNQKYFYQRYSELEQRD